MYGTKTNMTLEKKATMKMYLLLNMVIFHCHGNFFGEVPQFIYAVDHSYKAKFFLRGVKVYINRSKHVVQ